MSLSRKEFLRRGVATLGEALLNPAHLFGGTGEGGAGVAEPRNDRCLAQRGGCFSCLESCPEEAITLEPGSGVRIDRERCTGCGRCVDICPVTPKALAIAPAAKRPPVAAAGQVNPEERGGERG
jgi:Pyruvate/2-oxoacid:ferredoxin oxidoreductase delta subunit